MPKFKRGDRVVLPTGVAVSLDSVGTSIAWWRGAASGRLYSTPLENLRRAPDDPSIGFSHPAKVYVRRRPGWHFYGLNAEWPWAVVTREREFDITVEAYRTHAEALAAALIVAGVAEVVEPCS